MTPMIMLMWDLLSWRDPRLIPTSHIRLHNRRTSLDSLDLSLCIDVGEARPFRPLPIWRQRDVCYTVSNVTVQRDPTLSFRMIYELWNCPNRRRLINPATNRFGYPMLATIAGRRFWQVSHFLSGETHSFGLQVYRIKVLSPLFSANTGQVTRTLHVSPRIFANRMISPLGIVFPCPVRSRILHAHNFRPETQVKVELSNEQQSVEQTVGGLFVHAHALFHDVHTKHNTCSNPTGALLALFFYSDYDFHFESGLWINVQSFKIRITLGSYQDLRRYWNGDCLGTLTISRVGTSEGRHNVHWGNWGSGMSSLPAVLGARKLRTRSRVKERSPPNYRRNVLSLRPWFLTVWTPKQKLRLECHHQCVNRKSKLQVWRTNIVKGESRLGYRLGCYHRNFDRGKYCSTPSLSANANPPGHPSPQAFQVPSQLKSNN